MGRKPQVLTSDPRIPVRSGLHCGIAAFVLLFLVLPLAVAPGYFVQHDVTPKLVVLAFAICLALFGIAEWYPGLVQLWRRPAGKWFSVLLGLSAISIVLSTFLSVDPHLSLA